jgi:hypothetical protein
MPVKYALTVTELRELKIVCKYCHLAWQAQAARPEVARRMIRAYLDTAKKTA